MNGLTRRHAICLQEIGVGPIWKLRDAVTPSAEAVSTSDIDEPMVPGGNSASILTDWPALEAAVTECSACGLCTGRTKTVLGSGDRKAAWLFIGEGPGYNEDLQGAPFVGRSGQLLDGMLAAMGLRRDMNTFIANIVKCRPTDDSGKDRPPTSGEADACKHYLDSQIALIEPEIIIALGKTAAVTLLRAVPQATLSSLRGKVHSYVTPQGNEIPLVATYHPAYLLRQLADKKKAWADLCLAMRSRAGGI